MRNLNFTDWQDLWLKKDVEGISKKINNAPVINFVILIDLIIAIITLSLGVISILQGNDKYIKCLYILIISSIIIPLIIFIYVRFRFGYKKLNNFLNNKMDIKYYIDIFDNKISNCIMMASTLCDTISTDNRIEENIYLISETSYYINKCIKELERMNGNMLEKIFNKNKDKNDCNGKKELHDEKGNNDKKIAHHRLLLVIVLIKKVRNEIIEKIKKLEKDINNEDTSREIINYITNVNKNYDVILEKFILELNDRLDIKCPIGVSTDIIIKSTGLAPEEIRTKL